MFQFNMNTGVKLAVREILHSLRGVSQASPAAWRFFSTLHASPEVQETKLSFCVVGTGPAGFYTAEKVFVLVCSLHVHLVQLDAVWMSGCGNAHSNVFRMQLMKRFGPRATVDLLVRPLASEYCCTIDVAKPETRVNSS